MDYKIKPWQHQLKAIKTADGRDCLALFFEQGTGKTSTQINILRQLYAKTGSLLSTLILCPSIVIENWQREFKAHSEISSSEIVPLVGAGWRKLITFDETIGRKSNRILITNYETIYQPVWKKIVAWSPKVLVLDESQKAKDSSSVRTKKCIEISRTADYRYLLSGTPIVNSLFDIWSQFQILDQGQTFGSFFEFRKNYFIDENAGRPRQSYFPNWQPKQDAATQIGELVNRKAVRAVKSHCLDLPPFIRQVVHSEMGEDQQKAYRQMELDAVVDLPSGDQITADLAIKKALRLQQIVTGYMVDDDGKRISFKKNPRIDALKDIIQSIDAGHQIIIWAVFKQNYADIAALLGRLGISYVEVHGDIPESYRQAHIDAFNSGAARIFLGNPHAAGVGLNLVAASYAIFYSRSFSLEADLQAEARNYRGGSEKHEKITRIDIVTPDTIDERIMVALRDKQSISQAVIDYLKQPRKRTQ